MFNEYLSNREHFWLSDNLTDNEQGFNDCLSNHEHFRLSDNLTDS